MKTFFQILFVLCLPLMGMAQGNLQFNQVRYIEVGTFHQGTLNPINVSPHALDSVLIIVPVGKVLKIESASANLKGRYDYDGTSITLVDNYIYNSCPTLSLNDRILMTCYSSSSVIPATHLPIWLNAGTYTLKIQANQEIVQNSTSPTILAILPINFKGFISAIEFNIIP